MATLPEKETPVLVPEGKVPIIVESGPKLDKEVEPLVRKLEEDVSLTQPVTDDSGQPLVSPAAPQNPTIVLPITGSQYQFGLTQKVSSSIRWLAVWCLRLVKIFGSGAAFREAENKT